MADPYATRLLADATARYPFVKFHNPMVTIGTGQDDYAETWPTGETGDKQYPRPANFPIDRIGIQVFRPQAFGANDLAAEMLHIDPYANSTRDMLMRSLTPGQVATLKKQSGDYRQSVDMGLGEDKAMSNAIDSAMRGYTVGQWPQSANDAMQYNPQQRQMLDSLKSYMTTGVYPSSFDLAITR